MKCHIYFHHDFDGTVCAALLWQFFRSRGDEVVALEPVSYHPNLKKEWPLFSFKRPFVVVDFCYHPQADWWFDHHATAFLKKKWRQRYRNDTQHHLDANFPSCYGLIADFLKRTYRFNPSRQLKNILPWADRIDSADYPSPRQSLWMHSAAQQLAFLLDDHKWKEQDLRLFQRRVIKELAFGDLNRFLHRVDLRRRLLRLRSQVARSYRLYRHGAVIEDKVSFLDKTDKTNKKVIYTHFIARILFPRLSYSVFVEKERGRFSIGMARNHWMSNPSSLDLARLMKKYGGGGHKDVAKTGVNDKSRALRIAREIVKYLNRYG